MVYGNTANDKEEALNHMHKVVYARACLKTGFRYIKGILTRIDKLDCIVPYCISDWWCDKISDKPFKNNASSRPPSSNK